MLKIIADQVTIKKYNRQFIRRFKPLIDEKIKIKLGHQGASFPATVFWSKKLGLWFFPRAIKEIRYWNAFGTGRPKPGVLVSTTAEINFPWSGIDRKTGGAFAKDAWGNVFVVHRGKIGGGKKGVGKSLFEQNYRGIWSFLEDGEDLTQVAVVGALNSVRFAAHVAQFVKKIELLKLQAVRSAQTQFDFPEINFRENRVGSPPQTDEPDISAKCDRELVISALAAILKRWNFKIGNSENCELFLFEPTGKISHVFEFLTDIQGKNVMAAAARSLLSAQTGSDNPLAILVLPEEKTNEVAQILQKINVEVIGFRFEEERIVFPDLSKIRLDQSRQL